MFMDITMVMAANLKICFNSATFRLYIYHTKTYILVLELFFCISLEEENALN